jgi:hypothetical protein
LSSIDRDVADQADGVSGALDVVGEMLRWINNSRQVVEYSAFVKLLADDLRDAHTRALAASLEIDGDPIGAIKRQGLLQRLNVVLRTTVASACSIERVSLKNG